MLNLAVARVGFGKTHFFRKIISEKIKNNEENLVLVVPNGQIANTERAVLDLLGEDNTFKVKVRNFYSLAEDICEKTKKLGKKILDPCERFILMNMAISSVKSTLTLYENCANSPEFAKTLLTTLDELKSQDATIDLLAGIEEKLPTSTLKSKLTDIILIFRAYEELLCGSFVEPLDIFPAILEILKNHDIFSGYTLFFDGFSEFTGQQLMVMEQILIQSKDVYVAFCADSLDKTEPGLFGSVTKNINGIVDLAKKNNVPVNVLPIIKKQNKFKFRGLTDLERNFLRYKKEKFSYNPDDIVVYRALDVYDEIDFVATTIKKMVRSDEFDFGDFAIFSANKNTYNDAINTTFKKYGIPVCNTDKTGGLSPIANVALAAMQVISSGFSSEAVLRYLKSGVPDFSVMEICSIENYTFVWKVDKEDWKSDFYSNPRGFCHEFSETDKEDLEKINVTRRKLVEPFFRLLESTKNCDSYGITKALYSFLVDISAKEQCKKLHAQLINTGSTDLAGYLARDWDSFIDLMDKMASLSNGDIVSVNQYSKILEHLVLCGSSCGYGKNINSVAFEAFGKAPYDNPRVSFVVGCTETDFLKPKKELCMFTPEEKNRLGEAGIDGIFSFEELVVKEQFLTYKALLAPSDKLFVTWPNSIQVNQNQRPSEIIGEIERIFPNVTVMTRHTASVIDSIVNNETLLSTCANFWGNDSQFAETLKHYLYSKDELCDAVKILESASKKSPVSLQKPEVLAEIFPGNVVLSASQVEKYYLCPFQFFCRYVLKINSNRPAQFDSLEYGRLMHFVLEKVFSKYSAKEILLFAKNHLETVVSTLLYEYSISKFGVKNNSFRFKYLISRFIKTACPLILHIAAEQLQSEFVATGFELPISKTSAIKPLYLPMYDGSVVEIIGKIDRVDIMNKGDKNYIRVIDYKTGTKELVLADIAYGLNIQMLIYLLATIRSQGSFISNPLPAGALYMPAQKPMVTADKDVNPTKVAEQKQKKLRMSGVILNSPEVIFGMEKDAKGLFIPVVAKDGVPKQNDSLVSSYEMEKILNYVENRVVNVATAIKGGKIEPYPVKGEHNACEYCEYFAVCGFCEECYGRETEKLSKDAAFEKILDNLK